MTVTLGALVLATPLFGFSLTPPGVGAAPIHPTPAPDLLLDVDTELDAAAGDDTSDDDEAGLADAIRRRREIADIHMAFGIATWVSMAVTAVFGVLQLYDEYGFVEDEGNTPCARGDAIFGWCGEREFPWAHAIAAGTTTVLYGATFTLSFVMPDPLDVESSDTELGEDLRIHEALRWAHLAGVVVLATLGAVSANIEADYEVRRGLAWAHAGTAVATFGTLTAAGAIMIF